MGHMSCVFPSVLLVWDQGNLKDLFVNVIPQRNQLQLLLRAPKCINICMLNTRTLNLVVLPILMTYNRSFRKKK